VFTSSLIDRSTSQTGVYT
jgi:hypothetical protein